MSNKFRLFCALIILAVSVVPAFGQSSANQANDQPVTNPAAPDPSKTSLLQSELSSAALAPCVIIPPIGQFQYPTTENTPVMNSSNKTLVAWVTWNVPGLGTCVPTTCTWTISSVPPGPCVMYLKTPDGIEPPVSSTPVLIDSTTGVITYSDWFGPNIDESSVLVLEAVGDWIQIVKPEPPPTGVTPYPTLQWGLFNVTLVYQ